MGARQAGFALVGCLSPAPVNDLLAALLAQQLPPLAFELPTPVDLGSGPITVDGTVGLLPPTVSFDSRSDDRVGVHGRFAVRCALQRDDGGEVLQVTAELGTDVLAAIAIDTVDGRLQPRLDLSQVSVEDVTLSVSEGSPLPTAYADVLRSPQLLDLLTTLLRDLTPDLTRLLAGGVPATIAIAPNPMPCGASLFDPPPLFSATLTVSRVVCRPVAGALVVGVDLAGLSSGDPAALPNLFAGGPVPTFHQVRDAEGGVAMSFPAIPVTGCGVAVSAAADVLSAAIAQVISPAAVNAFVDCHVALDSVGVRWTTFPIPLRTYDVAGLTLDVDATYYATPHRDGQSRLTPGGISASTSATLNIACSLVSSAVDPTRVVHTIPAWIFDGYGGDIDVPWWLTAGLVVVGINHPFLLMPVAVAMGALVPAIVGQLADQAASTVAAGINGGASTYLLASQEVTPPGVTGPAWTATVDAVSITADGLEIYGGLAAPYVDPPSPDHALVLTAAGQTVRDGGGAGWPVRNTTPIPCTVRLVDGVVTVGDPSVRVRWRVWRSDTREQLLDQDLPYFARPTPWIPGSPAPTTPQPLRIAIDHTTGTLTVADGFDVQVRVYRTSGILVTELGSAAFHVTVADRLDRHHPYVHWEHRVLWTSDRPVRHSKLEYRRSALHRTAVPGRCEMVDRASPNAILEYADALPFPADQLVAHRDELCDYCFFGGPDKTVPLV